jgi:acetyltransferase-like isoleucine patch superfamily enzyme
MTSLLRSSVRSSGCVIGAGSVVTKDIPDWAVAVGNPARVIRYRREPSDGALA